MNEKKVVNFHKYELIALEILKQYLMKNGYPENTFHEPFCYEVPYCDLMIQNKNTLETMACFEIKSEETIKKNGFKLVDGYTASLKDTPFYFVYLDESQNIHFLMVHYHMTEQEFFHTLDNESIIPSYEELLKQYDYQKVNKEKKVAKKKKDTFWIICYTSAIVIIFLFILELFQIFHWTMERIIVLILIIVLLLLPLFTEIQIGDYTFKRKKQD